MSFRVKAGIAQNFRKWILERNHYGCGLRYRQRSANDNGLARFPGCGEGQRPGYSRPIAVGDGHARDCQLNLTAPATPTRLLDLDWALAQLVAEGAKIICVHLDGHGLPLAQLNGHWLPAFIRPSLLFRAGCAGVLGTLGDADR